MSPLGVYPYLAIVSVWLLFSIIIFFVQVLHQQAISSTLSPNMVWRVLIPWFLILKLWYNLFLCPPFQLEQCRLFLSLLPARWGAMLCSSLPLSWLRARHHWAPWSASQRHRPSRYPTTLGLQPWQYTRWNWSTQKGLNTNLRLQTIPTFLMQLSLPEWSCHTPAVLGLVRRALVKWCPAKSISLMAPSLMKHKWERVISWLASLIRNPTLLSTLTRKANSIDRVHSVRHSFFSVPEMNKTCTQLGFICLRLLNSSLHCLCCGWYYTVQALKV